MNNAKTINYQEFRLIRKHLAEAESPQNAKDYFNAISEHISEFLKTSTSDYIEGDILYLFSELRRAETEEYLSSSITIASGKTFDLLGSLEIYEITSQRKLKEVYCCLELFHKVSMIFWVDSQGRISSTEESLRYDKVYNRMYPNSFSFDLDKWRKPEKEITGEELRVQEGLMIEEDQISIVDSMKGFLQKRYFSYVRWLITAGFSPFMYESDCDEVKQLNGKEVENSGLQETVYFTMPWAHQEIPSYCAVSDKFLDEDLESILNDKKLFGEYKRRIRRDWYPVPKNFCTPALIVAPAYQGLALVSVERDAIEEDQLVHFSLRSSIYLLSEETKVQIHKPISDGFFSPFPMGDCFVRFEKGRKQKAQVYMTSIDRFRKFLVSVTGRTDLSPLPKEDIDKYILIHDEDTPECRRLRDIYIQYSLSLLDEAGLSKENNNKTKNEYVKDRMNLKRREPSDSLRSKVKRLKDQGYTIGQAARSLGMDYKKTSKLWNE